MRDAFNPVFLHRFKYFLSPQLDLYRNIAKGYVANRAWTNDVVLDYGCGTGFGTLQLMRGYSHPIGIDCDQDALSFACDVLGNVLNFYQTDWAGEREPEDLEKFAAMRFSLVTCIEVIEHVSHPVKLLERLARITRDGGTVILSTLNHNSDYRKNDAHVGKFTVASLRELTESVFPSVFMTDYQLTDSVSDDSTRTPVVAVCQKTKA